MSRAPFPRKYRAEDRLIKPNSTIWEKGKPDPPQAAALTTHKVERANLTGQRRVKAETPILPIIVKSFQQLPHWDFEDIYSEDTPLWTKCAKSVRKSSHKTFRKAFLPNVRLFLHKDNMNMSEWNRLSHFNSPFGFMGLHYDEIMASVKLIPKPTGPLLSPRPGGDGCIRCAVVGMGGILNGSRMGQEIDAHDYVFRMNGAMTKGFEADVGNRTSVYVHSAHSIVSSKYFLKRYGYESAPHDEGIKYVMMPEALKDFQWLEGLLKRKKVTSGRYRGKTPINYYSGQYNESRFYVLHQDFLRYIRNRFLRSPKLKTKRWSVIRPTNGAFTIFLALHTCDTVDIYGFITDNFKKYSNYYFQSDAKKGIYFHPHHDFLQERDMWIDLHKKKIIRLYQRNDTGKVQQH